MTTTIRRCTETTKVARSVTYWEQRAYGAEDELQQCRGELASEKATNKVLLKDVELTQELLANLAFAVKLLWPLFGGTAQVQHMQALVKKASGE